MNNSKISQLVYPLNQFGQLGKIHTDFNHSFNISVGGQLIHIGSYNKYMAGFGVYVNAEKYEEMNRFVQVGNVVKMFADKFVIYSNQGIYTTDLDGASIISLEVRPVNWDKTVVQDLYKVFQRKNVEKLIGLEMTVEAQDVVHLLSKEQTKSIDWQHLVNYLIGRGKGLTPSGDDILVGYLSTMIMFDQNRAEIIKTILSKQDLSTTDVSNAYLQACMKGYVSSPIFGLYQAINSGDSYNLLKEKVENIMQIGHTSGKDMAYGIQLGIYYIYNNLLGE